MLTPRRASTRQPRRWAASRRTRRAAALTSAEPPDPPPHPPGPVRRTAARLLVRGADATTRWVTRLLGAEPTAGRERISESELRGLIAANTVIDREELRLIEEVLASGTRHISALMVPRTEVTFLHRDLLIGEAINRVREDPYSRFPVTGAGQDDVVGFVHLRDLLLRPAADPVVVVGQLTREVKRLPASMRVLAALSEMRREGHHLAVVVDEYGGTAGIVTLEDLIEELVGEIHDEYDPAPEPQPDGGLTPTEVDGLLNLADFAERTGLMLPVGPYETVGGFLMAWLGRLPAVGDEVRLGEWRIVAAELDGRRVARVGLFRAATPAARTAATAVELVTGPFSTDGGQLPPTPAPAPVVRAGTVSVGASGQLAMRHDGVREG